MIKKLFIGLLFLLFLSTSASAALVTYGFDVDGNNGVPSFDMLSGFQFDGIGSTGLDDENTLSLLDTGSDIYVAQSLYNGAPFTENFTLMTVAGLDENGSSDYANMYYGADPLFLDVQLSGTISGITMVGDNVSFLVTYSGGSADFYIDGNGNADYDAGDTMVATLDYDYALPFNFEASLLGTGGSASVDVAFKFTDANADYWDTSFETIVGKGFMLALTQGDLTLQQADITGDTPPELQMGWTVISVDSVLNPIPEPSTMLLFGAGLLGFAGLLRKKRQN